MFIVILFLLEHPTEAEYTDCHKDVGKTKAEIKHRFSDFILIEFSLHQILFDKLVHHKLYCIFHKLSVLVPGHRNKLIHRLVHFG